MPLCYSPELAAEFQSLQFSWLLCILKYFKRARIALRVRFASDSNEGRHLPFAIQQLLEEHAKIRMPAISEPMSTLFQQELEDTAANSLL